MLQILNTTTIFQPKTPNEEFSNSQLNHSLKFKFAIKLGHWTSKLDQTCAANKQSRTT
ncbi:hypothetical protein V6Z12_D07G137500 [Gossypium hirsutum]